MRRSNKQQSTPYLLKMAGVAQEKAPYTEDRKKAIEKKITVKVRKNRKFKKYITGGVQECV